MNTMTLRSFFPAYSNAQAQDRIYFDSAATSLKLESVIEATQHYYQFNTTNVHRSSHKLAVQVTEQFEQARCDIKDFICAQSQSEIVWTKGATDSLNLVAYCLSSNREFFKPGDEIVIANSEHHSNILPWQRIAENLGLNIKVMPVDEQGKLLLDNALQIISEKTALVAVAHVSNALGNINPIQDIIAKAKSVNALTVIDGTQAVAHMPVNVQNLDCDFYAFSGHKMFGPTGIGVLYGKQSLLDKLPPYQLGGEMVKNVSFVKPASYQASPLKFEAGTPNIAGVLGISKAARFIQDNIQTISTTEKALYQSLKQALLKIPNVQLWGDLDNSISVQSFTVKGCDSYDLAVLLDKQNIALRVGHHCAMPLMNALKLDGTLRVSLACYNTLEEVFVFVKALVSSIDILTSSPLSRSDTSSLASANKSVPNMNEQPINIGPLAEKIMTAKSWDETYRQLMLAGKNLNRLSEAEQTAYTQVFGCESQVWIKCSLVNNSLLLGGESPSKIVRGLLAIIFEVLEHKTLEQVLSFSLNKYLDMLGLGRHLSQSRGNGVASVVEKIMRYCEDNK